MGKKAIRTLIGFEISETGKVARSQYPDRLNLALAISLTELPKQGTIRGYERRPTMQLKLAIDEAAPSTAHKSTAQYSIVASCNKCNGMHDMGISVTMENGPASKQSIGELYDGKSLPKNLANLTNTSISCPKTGRQSTQKNNHQIFLVPTKN
jgi:hypothetical protein